MACFFYSRCLAGCGARSIKVSPLFWAPDYFFIDFDLLTWSRLRLKSIELVENAPTSRRRLLCSGVSLQ